MFWMICAALAAIAALTIALPFLRRRTAASEPTAAYDLRVYRDQLREVERDLERGIVEPQDAERMRIEIGRKVLEADRAMEGRAGAGRGPSPIWPLLLLVLTVALGFGIYVRLGAPELPDAPIASRIAAAERLSAERPAQAQAEAEASAGQRPTPTVEPEYLALIERLREAVAQRPDEPQGLRLLAEHEARLGNIAAARQAQQQLVEVLGDGAGADDHVRLATLMIEAAGGLITPEAEQQVRLALQEDNQNLHARYIYGLLHLQNGRPDLAFPVWADLLVRGPEDAPWITPIRAIIMDLAWLAGQPDYSPPAPGEGAPMMPGPSAADLDAAEQMTPEAREEMIGGMVDRLMDRLANQGGTADEWAQLISSLTVIGRGDQARGIWAEAQTRFADQPEALSRIDAAAENAGLTP